MAQPDQPPAQTTDPNPPYSKSDSILFQAWLILFLLVICFALVNYLISYIPR